MVPIQPFRLFVSLLRTGLPLAAAGALLAQEVPPTPPPANQLTVSVASNIGQGCGSTFASPLVQDLETQLRGAGIGVSRVHTGTVAADVDCVPLTDAAGKGLAVHQCLSLSRVVAVPSHANGLTMATTWRQCQQYTCAGRNCEELGRTGQRALVDALVADLKTPVAQAPDDTRQTAQVPVPGLAWNLKSIYFLIYILMCVAVLVRWQIIRQFR